MRLTGGKWSGRILQAPKGPGIRPTQDYVRAALFNILGARVEGARVLDLFAGSGAMGIEALSRGASHVTFVDKSPFCIRAIRENLSTLDITDPVGRGPARCRAQIALAPFSEQTQADRCSRTARGIRAGPLPTGPVARILRSEVVSAIRKLAGEGAIFDLVILDPPYEGDLAIKSLNALSQHAIVSPSGSVIAEHDKRDSLPAKMDGGARQFVSQRIERYGDTALTFFA